MYCTYIVRTLYITYSIFNCKFENILTLNSPSILSILKQRTIQVSLYKGLKDNTSQYTTMGSGVAHRSTLQYKWLRGSTQEYTTRGSGTTHRSTLYKGLRDNTSQYTTRGSGTTHRSTLQGAQE